MTTHSKRLYIVRGLAVLLALQIMIYQPKKIKGVTYG